MDRVVRVFVPPENVISFANDLAQNNRKIFFFLAMVFMCVTAFGLLNGLIGIFSNAFQSASKIAFAEHGNHHLHPLEMRKHEQQSSTVAATEMGEKTIRRESLWSVILEPSVYPDKLLNRRHSSASTTVSISYAQMPKQALSINTANANSPHSLIGNGDPTHLSGPTLLNQSEEDVDQEVLESMRREKEISVLCPSPPELSTENENKAASPSKEVSDHAAVLKEKQLTALKGSMQKLRKAYKKNSQLMRRAMDDLQTQIDVLAASY